ncbi:hypothetical protein HDU76_001530 [Blyttiomyces sp. JEL0837]|nr:hypothetical protein HDU76_001530 [Blyttiomyces sp. JEL0837]
MAAAIKRGPRLASSIVDIHTHVYLPRYMDALRARTQVPRIFRREGTNDERLLILPHEDLDASTRLGRPVGPEYYDINVKLAFMDKHGIDRSVISLANPWLDFLEPKESIALAKDLNKDLDDICAKSAGRLFGFGVLPSLSPSGSVDELERVSKLKYLRGVILGTHGAGKGLDDPELEPMFAKAAEKNLTIFLHPHYGVPSTLFGDHPNGHVLPLALGFPFETTIAVSRMILSGLFDRVPNLKILLAHTGGTLPFLAGRLDSCVSHDAHVTHRQHEKQTKNNPSLRVLSHPPSHYLKTNFLYDAVSYNPHAIKCVAGLIGGFDKIMFGTDNPFFPPLEGKGVYEADGTPWLSVQSNYEAIKAAADGDQAKVDGVLGGNAIRELNLV